MQCFSKTEHKPWEFYLTGANDQRENLFYKIAFAQLENAAMRRYLKRLLRAKVEANYKVSEHYRVSLLGFIGLLIIQIYTCYKSKYHTIVYQKLIQTNKIMESGVLCEMQECIEFFIKIFFLMNINV